MPEAKHIRKTTYASSADFCQVFYQEMNSLYLLSFLLAADREKAEQSFVFGLEQSAKGNPIFKEWARSWARRSIIQNAIRILAPTPMNGVSTANSATSNNAKAPLAELVEITAILGLPTFERFVYVMAVLEHYSDQECSVLLGCARRDVTAARTRGQQKIGSAMESLHERRTNSSSRDSLLCEKPRTGFQIVEEVIK